MITTKKTLHIMLAGEQGTGKTIQIERAFNLAIRTPADEGHPFRPAIFITIGGDTMSAGGTAGEMLSDPACVHVQCGTVDEVRKAIEKEIPKGHATLGPFRLVAIDSWSALRNVALAEVNDQAVKDGANTNLGGSAQKSIAFNFMDMSNRALPSMIRVVQALRSVMSATSAPPRLFVSTCHTVEEWKGQDPNRVQVGTKLAVQPSFAAANLVPSANIIWQTVRIDPDFSRLNVDQINASPMTSTYEIHTRCGTYPRYMYCGFIKRQGAGSMAVFDQVPTIWKSPDLAYPLAQMLAAQHGFSSANAIDDEEGRIIGYTLHP
jgi:hypothetical protein